MLETHTDASRVAIKAAGCTHAVVSAKWDQVQPDGAGTAVDATQLVHDFDHAVSVGLQPILSIDLHYPPTWVLDGVEKFKDQSGNEYTATQDSGKNVRNWMWTALGRTYVADVITKVATALGPTRVAATAGVRCGGGWFGEVHYPEAVSGGPTHAWQAFGASMQAGTGIAAGMPVCPVPGYTPFTGTDAQDVAFLNWYLNGIVAWVRWQVEQFKAAGFTRNLWVLMPGWGIRTNQTRADDGYRGSAALGEDHIRLLGEFMHDPAVWPYSTWLNNADAFANGDTADSSKSAWKSIYEKSLARGKHHRLIGENTENETPTSMASIFDSALGRGTYPGTPGIPDLTYYRGTVWLDYATLTGGGAGLATLADYAANIADAP